MAIGKRKPQQKSMWISAHQLPKGKGHPFYTRLNRLLEKDGFDSWVEELCAPCFAAKGRPSIPPGVYFRMLFIGYLEGFASDRAIAWNCQDRLSLRAFLGIPLHQSTPDHSSLSIWRQRLPMEIYRAAFQRILAIVHRQGLISAYAAGIDSTTIEANASLKRLARKDSGASYLEYVKQLMREAGEDPTDVAAVIRFDRKRKGKKLSNDHWRSETDPDARIAKMKNGTTHLAYKSEHAIDLSSGAMLAAEIYPGDCGDTECLQGTLDASQDNLHTLDDDEPPQILCVATDKGYHQAELIRSLNQDQGITTYIPERDSSKRRRWHGNIDARREFHANRQRAKGKEGKRLGRLRSWLVERSFAHLKCSGNMARMTVRGFANVAKRYLMHAAGYNIALVMRHLYKYGTPREAADVLARLFTSHFWPIFELRWPFKLYFVFCQTIERFFGRGLVAEPGRLDNSAFC
jgi:transposase